MSANNPVFQVLVPTGDQVVLPAGSPVTSLAVGQIGVFSATTNLSQDATTIVNERAIFLAVGVDTAGGSTLNDVATSAGQNIPRNDVDAYSFRCYNPERPNIIDITDFTNIACETTYSFKVEFRGNSQAYQMYGFNQFSKIFSVTTPCCGPGCDCPSGDCNNLALLLFNAVNADTDEIIKASIIDYTTTPGTPIVVATIADYINGTAAADVAAWVATPANAGLCLGIRITDIPSKVYAYCNIPLRYYKNVEFLMIVSLIDNLSCEAKSTIFQIPSFGEGQGKDIGWLEYEAGGYNGKPGPYRVGEMAGTAIGNFQRFSTNAGKYNQLNLHYSPQIVGGWDEYKNKMNTIVVAECTTGASANNTFATLLPVLDAFFETQGFKPLEDALDNCDCSTVQFTSAFPADENGLG
jgi:hypothetical protein